VEYPGNFDTPAFPAGKRIAVTRTTGIGIMGAGLLIICLCGLISWGAKSMRLDPFLIANDSITGQWTVIGRSLSRNPYYSISRTMQEAVAINFMQSWFHISDVADRNEPVWRECPANECTGAETMTYNQRACAISCTASQKLYEHFTKGVVPEYKARALAGETWGVLPGSIQISPVAGVFNEKVDGNGTTWRIEASVWSNINAIFNIVAFVRVAQKVDEYPMTMGYYVEDFNSYRINR